MLVLKAVTVRLGGRVVLDARHRVHPGQSRVGLVGRNGSGKSTLLKIVAGLSEADEGTVETPRDTRIGYLVAGGAGRRTRRRSTHVLAADAERARLWRRPKRADRSRAASPRSRSGSGDRCLCRARRAPRASSPGSASTRRRSSGRCNPSRAAGACGSALAACCSPTPDLLLLDEPSNHLDLEASIWLESFLKTYRGDPRGGEPRARPAQQRRRSHPPSRGRQAHALLPAATTRSCASGASARPRARSAGAAPGGEAAASSQAYIDRWRYKAHTARQAQSRMKALARLEPIADRDRGPEHRLRLSQSRRSAAAAHHARCAPQSAMTPGKPVLSRLDLRIDPDDRIALLGRNGNGKTTLARLLVGPAAAHGRRHECERQAARRLFRPAPDRGAGARGHAAAAHDAACCRRPRPGAARGQLARFGFSGDKAEVAVRNLSGGERARLALALITPRCAASADPRRAHQPSRFRRARGAGGGAQRVWRRGRSWSATTAICWS